MAALSELPPAQDDARLTNIYIPRPTRVRPHTLSIAIFVDITEREKFFLT